MSTNLDAKAAQIFAERYAAARQTLRAMMEAHGLHESQGWRVSETTRDGQGGYRVILRPIHSRLEAPADMECVVWIDEDSGVVNAECLPGGKSA